MPARFQSGNSLRRSLHGGHDPARVVTIEMLRDDTDRTRGLPGVASLGKLDAEFLAR